ncbi:MAG: IS1595 family transposase [Pseudonocardiales bacterium]|nr:IS1595 family transposase [Pseudonocardiales bacterium]
MPRPSYPLSILEFQRRFGSEEACREYLFASRWPDGFVCPGCGSVRAGEMHQRRLLWQCKDCGQQTSATAGTVMHGTHMPLRTWFWAAYLVATHHPGISAKQLQRQLGLSRYETAWLILQKLRRAMVAPERELLKGEVEIDEFFLGGHEDNLKGGRQHGKKALIGAAIEVRGAGSGRLRLQALANSQATTLRTFTQATTAPGAIVHTDGLFSYRGLDKLGYEHRPRKVASVAPGEQLLPRAHRAISNLKAWMHGTHRSVSDEHLPVYLDEYVFRHNRRSTPMAAFQTLLGLGATHQPTTYRQITRRAA